MKYDVFISYRREGGYDTAKHLNDLLVRDGYKVSFDIDTLRNGDFDMQLLERIEQCKDFILIVDTHAFDRTLDSTFDPQKDWLRRELAHALKHKKNIIPIFLSNVSTFPEGLPEDIAGVVNKNAPKYSRTYFDDFYRKMKTDFLISKKHRVMRRLICLMGSLMFVTLGVALFFCKRSEYREQMLTIIENVIDTDPSFGVALLNEALPRSFSDKHHYNLLLPIEQMNTTKVLYTARAFDDECVAIDDSARYIATSLYGDEIIIRDLSNIDDMNYLYSPYLRLLGGRCCTFNSSQNKLALGYDIALRHSIFLFDIETNKEFKRYELDGSFDKLTYGNKYLVAYGGYSNLEIVSLEKGTKFSLKDLKGADNVVFSPNCDSVIYVASENLLSVYDIEKRSIVNSVYLNKSREYPMCFSDDGAYLYIGLNNAIYKFDSQSLLLIGYKNVSNTTICSIITKDNDNLVCGDSDGNLYQCDFLLKESKVLPSRHKNKVKQVAINQKGEIVSYSNGLILKNYDNECDVIFSSLHKGDLTCSYMTSEDGIILIGDSDGQLLVYEKSDYYTIQIEDEDVKFKSVNEINRCGKSQFLVFTDNQIALFDLLKSEVIDRILPEEGKFVHDVSFADGSIYFTSYNNYISSYIIRNNKISENNKIYGKSGKDIDCVSYLPQKDVIIYSEGSQLFRYLKSSSESTLIWTATDDINGIIINPKKNFLYLVCGEAIECISLSNSNKLQFKLDINFRTPNQVAISNDGRFILTSDYAGKINVWNALSGKHIKRINTGLVIEEIYFKEQSDELYLLTQNRGLVKMTLFEDMNAFLKNKENHRRLTDDEKRIYSISPIFSGI